MFSTTLLVVTVATAFACTPLTPGGDGSSDTKATLKTQIAPPATWTYNDPMSLGQLGTTEAAANKQAEQDITSSIRAILAENKYPIDALAIDIKYEVPPAGAFTADDCGTGEYLNNLGTVTNVCDNTNTAVGGEVSQSLSIDLTSKMAVTSTQWDQLAAKLEEKLEAKNVLFREHIKAA